MKIGVIDYSGGNLRSVLNALTSLGAEHTLVHDAGGFDGIDAIVFPGQGAFGDCIGNIRERGLFEPLREWIAADRPYLGICIGYQVLFDESEESPGTQGLGAIPGKVVHFPRDAGLKIPHMGWNQLALSDPSDPLWAGLDAEPYVYFVHSYYPVPADDAAVAATSNYGLPFAAAVRRGHLAATQFHPEKSQATGLRILKNFLESLGIPAT